MALAAVWGSSGLPRWNFVRCGRVSRNLRQRVCEAPDCKEDIVARSHAAQSLELDVQRCTIHEVQHDELET